MFCRNCGKELTGSPEICINCGAKPLSGTGFCPGCGVPTTPLTEICTQCGARVSKAAGEKTWKPTTAGILSIIAGAIGVIIGMVIAALGALVGAALAFLGVGGAIAGGFAVPLIMGIVAIVGGIYALKRRIWGLALAGSICALLSVWFLGIPAIIFVILGKSEFK